MRQQVYPFMQIVIPHYVSQRTEKGPGKGNNCLNDGAFAHPESSCPPKKNAAARSCRAQAFRYYMAVPPQLRPVPLINQLCRGNENELGSN